MKKLQYNSPVILSFFLLSLAALVLSYLTAGRSNALVFSVYRFSFKNIIYKGDKEHEISRMVN